MPFNPIERIDIIKFRHLEHIGFALGKRLTVIAGGNGTGKTSILGLLGHVFTYPVTTKTLFKGPFQTQFSEVFRFSETYDKGGAHKYTVDFKDGTQKKADSRETVEARKRRFRIDVGDRSIKGAGKFERPVIYLSLKRLIPLAQEKESSIILGSEDKLTPGYKELFMQYYNKVFATNINVSPQHTKSTNKEHYSPTTDNYDALGISAGQDNIGQLILSLLSFRQLKETKPNYDGGVFIIDELDATLYPAAQTNLLELLLKESGELNLQVIFTTHSTDILNHIFAQSSSHFKHHTEFIFLTNSSGRLEALHGQKILSNVLADLNHAVAIEQRPKKVNIYLEDSEGKIFFNNMIKNAGINKRVKTQNVSLGSGNYINLLRARFPEFNNSLIILDGDYRSKLESKYRKKVVFLPGTIRPESLILDFLKKLPESDTFWETTGGYTKRVFLQSTSNLRDDRTVMMNIMEAKYGSRVFLSRAAHFILLSEKLKLPKRTITYICLLVLKMQVSKEISPDTSLLHTY